MLNNPAVPSTLIKVPGFSNCTILPSNWMQPFIIRSVFTGLTNRCFLAVNWAVYLCVCGSKKCSPFSYGCLSGCLQIQGIYKLSMFSPSPVRQIQGASRLRTNVWPPVVRPAGGLWQREDPRTLHTQHSARLLLLLQVAISIKPQSSLSHLPSSFYMTYKFLHHNI